MGKWTRWLQQLSQRQPFVSDKRFKFIGGLTWYPPWSRWFWGKWQSAQVGCAVDNCTRTRMKILKKVVQFLCSCWVNLSLFLCFLSRKVVIFQSLKRICLSILAPRPWLEPGVYGIAVVISVILDSFWVFNTDPKSLISRDHLASFN